MKTRFASSLARRGRKGVSMVLVMFTVTTISVLAVSLVTLNVVSLRESRVTRERLSAQYVAEAGIALAHRDLLEGGTGVVGSEQNPQAYGPSSFWVEAADLGGNMTSLTATSIEDRAGTRIQAVLLREQNNLFEWGAFGDEGLTLDSNASIDSYDSLAGPYNDSNGSGSNTYANANGRVGSNADIQLDQNSDVHGDAVPGVAGTVTINGNATVSGSTVSSTQVVDMPDLDIPTIASSGVLSIAGGASSVLGSGDHHFSQFDLGVGATLTVTGPATVIFDSFEMASNSELIVDGSSGPVEFYVIDDYVINSNTLIASTTYDPADITFYLNSDNIIDPNVNVDVDEVDFNSNAQLYGTIYAPNAAIIVNSNFELFGALVARRVHLDSNSKVHFDENLLRSNVSTQDSTFTTLLWQVTPYKAMGIQH